MAARVIPSDAEALAHIKKYADENGYPPSVRELAEDWGVTKNAVQDMLVRWRREELVRIAAKNQPRALVLTERGMKLIGGTAQL